MARTIRWSRGWGFHLRESDPELITAGRLTTTFPAVHRDHDGRPDRGSPMQYRAASPSEPGPIFTGRRVLDEHGLRLGTITDVVYSNGGFSPEHLVVDPGPLRRARYVPVAGACQTVTGDIVVPWDRDWFQLAPVAVARPALTAAQRRALDAHYARR
jgi:hypothetical protein